MVVRSLLNPSRCPRADAGRPSADVSGPSPLARPGLQGRHEGGFGPGRGASTTFNKLRTTMEGKIVARSSLRPDELHIGVAGVKRDSDAARSPRTRAPKARVETPAVGWRGPRRRPPRRKGCRRGDRWGETVSRPPPEDFGIGSPSSGESEQRPNHPSRPSIRSHRPTKRSRHGSRRTITGETLPRQQRGCQEKNTRC